MTKCPLCGNPYKYPSICYCMSKEKAIRKMMANRRITASGCWEWTGGLSAAGYGLLSMRKDGYKHQRAYRVSYVVFKGDIPKGMTVDHICRNRPCFNPDHLRLLTMKDNILSGTGPTAKHANQTHCVHGHQLSGDNLYVFKSKDGKMTMRSCRACAYKRQRDNNWYRPRKEAFSSTIQAHDSSP